MSLVEAGFVSIKKEKYVDVSTSMTTLRSVDSPHNTVVSEYNLIDSLSSINKIGHLRLLFRCENPMIIVEAGYVSVEEMDL